MFTFCFGGARTRFLHVFAKFRSKIAKGGGVVSSEKHSV